MGKAKAEQATSVQSHGVGRGSGGLNPTLARLKALAPSALACHPDGVTQASTPMAEGQTFCRACLHQRRRDGFLGCSQDRPRWRILFVFI